MTVYSYNWILSLVMLFATKRHNGKSINDNLIYIHVYVQLSLINKYNNNGNTFLMGNSLIKEHRESTQKKVLYSKPTSSL